MTPSCRRTWSATPQQSPPLVAAAEHQDLHEPVEQDPVGDAGTMAAVRVAVDVRGEQGIELIPQGSVIQDGSTGTAV